MNVMIVFTVAHATDVSSLRNTELMKYAVNVTKNGHPMCNCSNAPIVRISSALAVK